MSSCERCDNCDKKKKSSAEFVQLDLMESNWLNCQSDFITAAFSVDLIDVTSVSGGAGEALKHFIIAL